MPNSTTKLKHTGTGCFPYTTLGIYIREKMDYLYHIYYKDQYTHNALYITQQASLLQCYHVIGVSRRFRDCLGR